MITIKKEPINQKIYILEVNKIENIKYPSNKNMKKVKKNKMDL